MNAMCIQLKNVNLVMWYSVVCMIGCDDGSMRYDLLLLTIINITTDTAHHMRFHAFIS